VASAGTIRRERLDWEAGDLWGNWLELSPLLHCWIDRLTPAGDWRNQLLHALRGYEAQRVRFVSGRPAEDAIASGLSWAAFHSPADLSVVLNRLRTAAPLDAELLQNTTVVLARRHDRRFAAYLVDPVRREDLISGDADLVGVFTSN